MFTLGRFAPKTLRHELPGYTRRQLWHPPLRSAGLALRDLFIAKRRRDEPLSPSPGTWMTHTAPSEHAKLVGVGPTKLNGPRDTAVPAASTFQHLWAEKAQAAMLGSVYWF